MFALLDEARRHTGRMLDTLGLGPVECRFRTIAEWQGARLRAYQPPTTELGPALLILPAPFKRAYIWDLLPAVSVVRHALSRGIRVYLLEWLEPGLEENEFGLAAYADRLPYAATEAIQAETGVSDVILAGHSLGGTFAAIFASLHPERIKRLVLLDAPLCFGKYGGPLARWAAVIPRPDDSALLAGDPIPGSFINLLSAGAVPDAFLYDRYLDAWQSLADPEALAIHTRVERWTLDEFPLPARLFQEALVRLYRENRFVAGQLTVGQRVTGVAGLAAPTLAVVNPHGRVVPPGSVLAALEWTRGPRPVVLRYQNDTGPALEHVGPLVSRAAHRDLWPEMISWMMRDGIDG